MTRLGGAFKKMIMMEKELILILFIIISCIIISFSRYDKSSSIKPIDNTLHGRVERIEKNTKEILRILQNKKEE